MQTAQPAKTAATVNTVIQAAHAGYVHLSAGALLPVQSNHLEVVHQVQYPPNAMRLQKKVVGVQGLQDQTDIAGSMAVNKSSS